MDSDIVFDWDDANRNHLARHQVSPEDAEEVIQNEPLDLTVDTEDGEERITSVGSTKAGRFLVVVTTMRNARIRVVTAFPAPKDLVDLYFIHKGEVSDGGEA